MSASGQSISAASQESAGFPADVRAQLDKILASPTFQDAELLSSLLRYVVEHTLSGDGDQLKEYRLGTEVFERGTSFDPRIDPVVRVSALRLRNKLKEYYEQYGQNDRLRIDVPKGAYAATFTAATAAPAQGPVSASTTQQRAGSLPPYVLWLLGTLIVTSVAGYAIYRYHQPRGTEPATGKVMLAVLPFVNLSGDPRQEYFSDGLTEEFIAQLGDLNPEHLGVIARTSIEGYKNTSKHVDQIGRELGVQYVLEGSVRRSDDRARITAQLIQVKDQTHIWAQSYDSSNRDLLSLETEIARTAAHEISSNLNQTSSFPEQPVAVVDPEAHELYLQGRFFWYKRDTADVLKSIDYFQKAIERDQNYAAAYSAMADAYAVLGANDQIDPRDAAAKARSAALKALALDPRLSEAHATLGHVKFFSDWDFKGAEAEYRRGLELNSGNASAHHFYGVMLMFTGRLNEAIEQSRAAQVLDPLSASNSTALGLAYLYAGRMDQAVEAARKALEIARDDATPHALMGFCDEGQNDFTDAVTELTEAVNLSHRDAEMLGWFGWILGRAGRQDEARRVLAELQSLPEGHYAPAYDLALVYAGLQDRQHTLNNLQRAVEQHDADIMDMKMEVAFQPFRSDPQFQQLLRQAHLAD